MSSWNALLHAARPRTLPLSLSGTIVSGGMAYYLGVFDWKIFLLNMLVVVLLQVLSNYANDLGDSEKGADNSHRIGPPRMVQTGAIANHTMKTYIQVLIGLALVSGVVLIWISRLLIWEKIILFLIGLLAIYAAIAYTRGRFSFGYRGLGDVFVFVFFGIVSVVGGLFLYIHHINNAAFLPAIGVGLWSVGVLHLNNMRDRTQDTLHQKNTIAVRIGRENSRIYFLILLLGGFIGWASYVFTQTSTNLFSYGYYLGLIPIGMILYRFFQIKEDAQYDTLLRSLALTTFLTSILFFLSQVI